MYIEYSPRLYSTRIGVLFGHCDYFLGEPLGFFGFRPCCGDRFVLEEEGDEVAEEGLSMGRFAAEMAVFELAAGHWEEGEETGGVGTRAARVGRKSLRDNRQLIR